MNTYYTNLNDIERERKWYVVDAKDKVLGRLSTKIASILRGKNKEIFSPGMDTGDYVIVINSDKIKLTGNKAENKEYQRYSGYFGGLKRIPYNRMKADNPERIIYHAVKGMLPKNKLGRQIIAKLKLFCGEEHPHSAQLPIPIN